MGSASYTTPNRGATADLAELKIVLPARSDFPSDRPAPHEGPRDPGNLSP